MINYICKKSNYIKHINRKIHVIKKRLLINYNNIIKFLKLNLSPKIFEKKISLSLDGKKEVFFSIY